MQTSERVETRLKILTVGDVFLRIRRVHGGLVNAPTLLRDGLPFRRANITSALIRARESAIILRPIVKFLARDLTTTNERSKRKRRVIDKRRVNHTRTQLLILLSSRRSTRSALSRDAVRDESLLHVLFRVFSCAFVVRCCANLRPGVHFANFVERNLFILRRVYRRCSIATVFSYACESVLLSALTQQRKQFMRDRITTRAKMSRASNCIYVQCSVHSERKLRGGHAFAIHATSTTDCG